MKLRALAEVLERTKLSKLFGTGFDGQRDYYQVYGWSKKIDYDAALLRYQRQDIARRVVDAHAQETWRNFPKVIGTRAFDTAWTRLIQQPDLRLWTAFERADKMANIGSFSIVFLGFDDGRNTELPVSAMLNRKLLYVQPYSYGAVKISEFEDDPTNSRYGRPKMYTISPQKENSSINKLSPKVKSKSDMEVHWSRVLHIIENPLESNVYGTPRLLTVWNLLDDLLKVVGGSAENYWLSARGGLHINVDKDMELLEGDAEELSKEVEEFHHQLRRTIRTRGVNVDSINHLLPDPTGVFEVIVKLIAGSTGIPMRILLGAEAGQLASTSDRSNWADRIAERQRSFADMMVMQPFIQRLQAAGVLPMTTVRNVEIEWPSTYRLTPLEDAQTAAQRARSAAIMIKVAIAGVDLFTVGEVREVMGLPAEIPPGDILRAVQPEESDGGDEDEDDDDETIKREEEQS